MRLAAALVLFAALCSGAGAADWTHYANARFGYAIDVPPGFAGAGESADADGEVFKAPTAMLTVYGGHFPAGRFEDEVKRREGAAVADGWGLGYQVTTPDAASYSGKRGGRILYVRLLALCHGAAFAAFEFDYGVADITRLAPVLDRLVRSFAPSSGSAACS